MNRLLKQLAKALIRLRICAGWSEPLLVAHHEHIVGNLMSWLIYFNHLGMVFLYISRGNNKIAILFLNAFCHANSVDPDERPRYDAFYLFFPLFAKVINLGITSIQMVNAKYY